VLEHINPFGWKVNKKIVLPTLICYSFFGQNPVPGGRLFNRFFPDSTGKTGHQQPIFTNTMTGYF
jgi:hypothetical protein